MLLTCSYFDKVLYVCCNPSFYSATLSTAIKPAILTKPKSTRKIEFDWMHVIQCKKGLGLWYFNLKTKTCASCDLNKQTTEKE